MKKILYLQIVLWTLFVLLVIKAGWNIFNPPAPKGTHWEKLQDDVGLSAGDLIENNNGFRIASYLNNETWCVIQKDVKKYSTIIRAKWAARECGINYLKK